MINHRVKPNPLRSLKFQLCAGSIALLGVTIASISYLLIERQKRILIDDLKHTILLQGRNVAHSSAKGLLRSDPEFDLIPLITRITEKSKDIESVVITDADGVTQADLQLQNIGSPLQIDESGFQDTGRNLLQYNERLLEDKRSFFLKTPVRSFDRAIGYVYMRYSKNQLVDSIRRAMLITVVFSAIAFSAGILISLWFFRRISNPVDVMMEGVRSIARGDFGTRIELATGNEFQLLADSFNDMTSKLQQAQKDLVSKELVERELEIARDIQNTLIPKNVYQPDGYQIAMHYDSAEQVGGDYVDVIRIDSRRIAFVLADVSGKGIPGLVIMAMLKIIVQALVRTQPDVKQTIRQVNRALSVNVRRNMFVTMFLAILDTVSGELVCSNAGHNPILLYNHRSGRCRFNRIKGRPLALFADADFHDRLREVRVRLQPGDLFLLFTDGLTDSRDERRDQFGYERVMGVCGEHAGAGAAGLVDRLVQTERSFRGSCPQYDDLTLLAVSVTGSVPRTGQPAVAGQADKCSS